MAQHRRRNHPGEEQRPGIQKVLGQENGHKSLQQIQQQAENAQGHPAEAEHIGCPRVVVVAVPADIPLAQELWHQLAEHHAPQEKFSPDPEQPEQIILHCNSPHFPQYLLPPAG